jgi:hypothetical protein
MKRREFLGAVATAVAAASARVPLLAQTPPKIMLFGFAVISKNGTSVVANLPDLGTHAAFLAGPSAVINRIATAAGNKPVPGTGSGVGDGHTDLGGKDTQLLCLKVKDVVVGNRGAATSIQANINDYVPRLPVVASKMAAASYTFAGIPPTSAKVSLNGGLLRMPTTKSNNQGTHDIPWQFQLNGTDVDKTYLLTDLLVFDSSASTIDVDLGNGTKPVTLQSGEALWFVNVPTQQAADKTVTTIEHAHEWFSLLKPPIKGTIEAVAKKTYTRTKGKVRFKHPCAPSPVEANNQPPMILYFPPDTDPCFVVME